MKPGNQLRRKLLLGISLWCLMVVAGSLFPFRFRNPNEFSWDQLTGTLRLHYSKFDLLVNVFVGLVGGVLSGFWIAAGETATGVEGRLRKSAISLSTQILPWIALVVMLSVGVEVAQIYFDGRIPNVYDMISQVLGFFLALAIVAGSGHRWIQAWGSWIEGIVEQRFFVWWLPAAVILYLITHWWPLIPAITPGEIKLKWQQGLLLGELRGDAWSAISGQFEQHSLSLGLRLIVSCLLGSMIGRMLPDRSTSMRLFLSIPVCLILAVMTESGRGIIEQLNVSILGFLVTLLGLLFGALTSAIALSKKQGQFLLITEEKKRSFDSCNQGTVFSEHRMPLLSRLEWLDGLRALACSYVFGVHFVQRISFSDESAIWSFRRFLEFGLGVSFFFMLSAAMISRAWWLDASAQWNWTRFIRDKLIRILPAYFVLIVALFFLKRQYRTTQGVLDFTSHLLFFHNFDDRTLYSIAPPLWYMACQVQAYLFLPLIFILFLSIPRSKLVRAVVCVLLAFVSWLAFYLATIHGKNAIEPIGEWFKTQTFSVTHSLPAHLPNLFMGAVIGWIAWRSSSAPSNTSNRWKVDFSVVLLLGLIVLLAGLPENWLPSFPASRYGFPWMPFLIILLVSQIDISHYPKRILQWIPLVLLGRISYGFYIYHYSILVACHSFIRYLPFNGMMVHSFYLVVSFLATCLVSYASYRFFELPIERFFKARENAGRTP